MVTATLLIFGRLADMLGGFVLYFGGMVWLAITSLIAGFSQNWLMLVIFRALQGLGLAAFLPSSIMILGRAYRPDLVRTSFSASTVPAPPWGSLSESSFLVSAESFCRGRGIFTSGPSFRRSRPCRLGSRFPRIGQRNEHHRQRLAWTG